MPRVVDSELSAALASAGAVVLRGARAVGKSETARRKAKSELRLDGDSPRAVLARSQPSTALAGDQPRLLDEWQVAWGLWNQVKHAVDDEPGPGRFILTGSALPDDDPLRHSGAGRFRRLLMRTMTLAESGDSTGAVTLTDILAGSVDLQESRTDFQRLVSRLVKGGWPGWIRDGEVAARGRIEAYLDDITEVEFPQVAGTRRDPRRFLAFLEAFAAVTAQPAPFAAITRRMNEASALTFGPMAVPELFDMAARLFLVEDLPAWPPKLRSKTTALQTPKRHFTDPSLAAWLLRANSDRLIREPETTGFLFESQVVHDLRVYAQALGWRGVFHFRDTKGRDEIDVVAETDAGDWIGIEVKLGMNAVDGAARSLLRVSSGIARPPAALVVVTPTGIAHRRDDAVLVVPLTVLGPG
jgi:predicted AAA+ superfamily ATPase